MHVRRVRAHQHAHHGGVRLVAGADKERALDARAAGDLFVVVSIRYSFVSWLQ